MLLEITRLVAKASTHKDKTAFLEGESLVLGPKNTTRD